MPLCWGSSTGSAGKSDLVHQPSFGINFIDRVSVVVALPMRRTFLLFLRVVLLARVLSVVWAALLLAGWRVVLLLVMRRPLLVALRSVLGLGLWAWLLLLLPALSIVIIVMRLEQFLSKFLLALVDVLVQLVPVFTNREFSVVVDWNLNFPFADWFVFRAMKLRNVWMLKCLLGCESFVWVKVH
jgi:hypothetical protein